MKHGKKNLQFWYLLNSWKMLFTNNRIIQQFVQFLKWPQVKGSNHAWGNTSRTMNKWGLHHEIWFLVQHEAKYHIIILNINRFSHMLGEDEFFIILTCIIGWKMNANLKWSFVLHFFCAIFLVHSFLSFPHVLLCTMFVHFQISLQAIWWQVCTNVWSCFLCKILPHKEPW